MGLCDSLPAGDPTVPPQELQQRISEQDGLLDQMRDALTTAEAERNEALDAAEAARQQAAEAQQVAAESERKLAEAAREQAALAGMLLAQLATRHLQGWASLGPQATAS